MAGDIITELSRWRMLAVRSRSASFRYRTGTVNPAQVARDLNVRYVVEGSVRRIGDRIRIGVQLIDGETLSQVWGERFDRAPAEIFDMQDEVVKCIVGTVVGRVQMPDAERGRGDAALRTGDRTGPWLRDGLCAARHDADRRLARCPGWLGRGARRGLCPHEARG